MVTHPQTCSRQVGSCPSESGGPLDGAGRFAVDSLQSRLRGWIMPGKGLDGLLLLGLRRLSRYSGFRARAFLWMRCPEHGKQLLREVSLSVEANQALFCRFHRISISILASCKHVIAVDEVALSFRPPSLPIQRFAQAALGAGGSPLRGFCSFPAGDGRFKQLLCFR